MNCTGSSCRWSEKDRPNRIVAKGRFNAVVVATLVMRGAAVVGAFALLFVVVVLWTQGRAEPSGPRVAAALDSTAIGTHRAPSPPHRPAARSPIFKQPIRQPRRSPMWQKLELKGPKGPKGQSRVFVDPEEVSLSEPEWSSTPPAALDTSPFWRYPGWKTTKFGNGVPRGAACQPMPPEPFAHVNKRQRTNHVRHVCMPLVGRAIQVVSDAANPPPSKISTYSEWIKIKVPIEALPEGTTQVCEVAEPALVIPLAMGFKGSTHNGIHVLYKVLGALKALSLYPELNVTTVGFVIVDDGYTFPAELKDFSATFRRFFDSNLFAFYSRILAQRVFAVYHTLQRREVLRTALYPPPTTADMTSMRCFGDAILGINEMKFDRKPTKHVLQTMQWARARMYRLLGGPAVGRVTWPAARRPMKITFVTRRVNRKLVNQLAIVRQLRQEAGWEVKEVELEGMALEEQARLATQTDVWLGMHGAGLHWAWLLPAGAALVEFKLGYLGVPVGTGIDQNTFAEYGSLSKASGIHHIVFNVPESCTRMKMDGGALRPVSFDAHIPPTTAVSFIRAAECVLRLGASHPNATVAQFRECASHFIEAKRLRCNSSAFEESST